MEKIRDEYRTFVTTNHVMDELATLLGRKTDYAFSARKVKRIFNSDIRIVWTIEADERKALEVSAKYADQKRQIEKLPAQLRVPGLSNTMYDRTNPIMFGSTTPIRRSAK